MRQNLLVGYKTKYRAVNQRLTCLIAFNPRTLLRKFQHWQLNHRATIAQIALANDRSANPIEDLSSEKHNFSCDAGFRMNVVYWRTVKSTF
jgi:hypothetical protein